MASRPKPRHVDSSSSESEEDDDEEEEEMPRLALKSKSKSGAEEDDKLVMYHRTAGNHTYEQRTKPFKFKIRVKPPSLHWILCQKCGGIFNYFNNSL
jgi:hypothetical protein